MRQFFLKHYLNNMKYIPYFLSILLVILNTCGCKGKPDNDALINIHLYPAQNTKIYLYKISFGHEKLSIIDSGIIKIADDSLVFKIPKEKDKLYFIQEDQFYQKFYFIPDTSFIKINGNILTGKCKIEASPASNSFNDFENSQTNFAAETKKYVRQLQNLDKDKDKLLADSLNKKIQTNLSIFRKRYINYADTVSNPAAFLAVYNNVDFGNDYAMVKLFINNAAKRFQNFESVQQLKQETLNFISIYEKEFNVGDSLPLIQLPDFDGNLFSPTLLKKKYYLINFWASWCPSCLVYNKYYKELTHQNFSSNKFVIVSVALDDNIQSCKSIIKKNNYNWIQLIDTAMWQGRAVGTLKFDSIPFNFLVSPQGRIIAKAIKPDSLLTLINASIK